MIKDAVLVYQFVTKRLNYPISVWSEDCCSPDKSWPSHNSMTYSHDSIISLIQNGKMSDICFLLAVSGQTVCLMSMLGFLNQISLVTHSIWMSDGMYVLISVCLYSLSDQ